MKRITSFLIACCMILMGIQWSAVNTQAAAKTVKIAITKADIKKQGFDNAMQKALNTAKEKATEKKPYVITVPAGKYQMKRTLLVYSNTKIVLEDVTLLAGKGKTVFHIGSLDASNKGATGYCYKNISIEGGTLDGKNHSGTVLKVGHAQNFKMTNVTLRNTKNAHLMETGGVKGLTIKNCRFENQVSTSKKLNYYEALQLDILVPWHLLNYRAETLNTTDVLIDECEFSNTPRGVGSHTAILNQPMRNITITNCTFRDMGSVAIQGLNWQDVTIENNQIEDSPRGIACYFATEQGNGTYLPSVIAKEGKTKTKLSDRYQAPEANMNVLIQDNSIITNDKKDPYASYERVALLAGGINMEQKCSRNSDHSGGLPVGDYYYSGIRILNNTIQTAGHGIRFMDIKNAEIAGNKITAKPTNEKTGYHGIQIMINCGDISVKDNIIQNAVTNGLFVNRGSNVTALTNNTITGSGKYGIGLENATVGLIAENVITNTKEKGIFVFSHSNAEQIKSNTIETVLSAEGRGIHVCDSSAAGTVAGNIITAPGAYGIIASSVSTIDVLENNQVTGATAKNIHASRDSAIKSGY